MKKKEETSFEYVVFTSQSMQSGVHHIKIFKKTKVVTGKSPFFVIIPFCAPYLTSLNIVFWQGSNL